MRPKYLRYNMWDPDGNLPVATADWTETALSRPPQAELSNPTVMRTIVLHLELFTIITPVRIDVFKDLLHDHPNQSFVQSVCNGLMHGFWPWAETQKPNFPISLDLSQTVMLDSA
jgi:hypothetical protein